MPDVTQSDLRPLRWLDQLTQVANVGGSLLIVGLVVLIGMDVFARNAFNAPISGVPEMVTLSIVAIVFLQAPQALKAGRMTRSDALLGALTKGAPRIARGLETLFDLLGALVIGVILYATWPIFARAWTRGEFIGAAGDFTAPVWPVKAMILLGGTLLALQFLARILRRHAPQDDAT
ncbi:TRAP transporter small permease subunit [Jannaschia sp. M317]|uniref:TRAP transporter small permease subunit n=1 Tax=Jannaschia sp. M317 TaxID=2867011 RepID=UPI0021A6701E|nr:TRAP transporter small permease subunit [Jannaschia sp. M317]UWQ17758.1 TRAP transporter small permease subunit [Jannaschia sp. M317]